MGIGGIAIVRESLISLMIIFEVFQVYGRFATVIDRIAHDKG
jgi:hypothetical protein